MNRDEKLNQIRVVMKEKGIEAYIIPTSDPHQSEYLPDHWKVREWASEFKGSAGNLVVTDDRAGLWTDGRYFIQAERELSGSEITLFRSGEEGVPDMLDWILERLRSGERVGSDGRLFSAKQASNISKKLSRSGIDIDLKCDIVEKLWIDRPELPVKSVFVHSLEYSGESRKSKIERVREEMKKRGADHYLLSSLDDIAWLYNIRGRDIDCNPVAISYSVVGLNYIKLFIDSRKLSEELKAELKNSGVEIEEYCQIDKWIENIEESSIYLDISKVNSCIYRLIDSSVKKIENDDIVMRLKSVKNSVELENYRNCQMRDGVAVVRFLYWLESELGRRSIGEVAVAKKLDEFRRASENYIEPSFETIAGYKDHGAIVHYQANAETEYILKKEGLLLIDSGGQYLDGTTDITRTISLGNPTAEEKHDYTLVLKGHIALSEAVFPKGTSGSKLDSIARLPLWSDGKDYRHGTGHGVGYLLSVHEGPQSISAQYNSVALEEGMLVTNEPGYYKEGKYGIRIENVLSVRHEKETVYGSFLGFEVMTYCPIDLDLVDIGLLDNREKNWLNSYHREVYRKLSPYLDYGERFWLKKKTGEI